MTYKPKHKLKKGDKVLVRTGNFISSDGFIMEKCGKPVPHEVKAICVGKICTVENVHKNYYRKGVDVITIEETKLHYGFLREELVKV